jgi:hypothetical protein
MLLTILLIVDPWPAELLINAGDEIMFQTGIFSTEDFIPVYHTV